MSALRESRTVVFDRAGKRQVEVKLQAARPAYQNVPLDILFVLDTTGSMGEEIQRLKTTIEIINLNLAALSSRPQVRFGLVLYRDQGDEYTTEVVPLTEDLASFKRSLEGVRADGGGDDPEDLQSALRDAMREIRWNPDGIRLAFVITDAAPHLDYGAGLHLRGRVARRADGRASRSSAWAPAAWTSRASCPCARSRSTPTRSTSSSPTASRARAGEARRGASATTPAPTSRPTSSRRSSSGSPGRSSRT